MRRIGRLMLLVGAVAAGAGCHHATIDTGATPSPQTIEKAWASGWIYGLVPPGTVETASRCPNGVARVETKLSFLNQLVGALTLGIYTPMAIKVTCAAAGSAAAGAATRLQVGADATTPAQALAEAARLARSLGRTVLVQF